MPEVGVGKEALPPADALQGRIAEVVGALVAAGLDVPEAGIEAADVTAIGRALAAVEVPKRSHADLLAEVFVEITAEAQGIDVPGEGVKDVMVEPGINIDIGGVAGQGVGVVGPPERGTELGKIARNVAGLRLPRRIHHLETRWVHIDNIALEVSIVEGPLVGVGAVDLQNVTAGDGRGIGDRRLQFFDVHAILAALDFLLDGVEAEVVAPDGGTIGDCPATDV